MGVNRNSFDSYGFTTKTMVALDYLQVLMSENKELESTPPSSLPPTQFRATLPPEVDIQTYKRSLVRFPNINASGSRINCGQIVTFNHKNSP